MFHIDYRPKIFQEFIGNIETKTILQNFLSDLKVMPRSLLFHGTSGCGKTTIARIIAKEIGCEELNIYEVNMSNNRGIDTAREIISTINMKSLYGNYKLYILDEIHKSTNDFQNALLKVIEDTPKHVFFILCTTEPDRVIKTVRNRCQQFKFEEPSDKELIQWLKKICDNEKIKYESDSLQSLIEAANNCPRQCLILLEKVKNFGSFDPSILKSEIIIEDENVISLCRRLLHKGTTWNSLIKILKEMDDDPESIRRGVLSYMSKVLLQEDNPIAALIIDCFKENFYDSKKAGLILSCYNYVLAKK